MEALSSRADGVMLAVKGRSMVRGTKYMEQWKGFILALLPHVAPCTTRWSKKRDASICIQRAYELAPKHSTVNGDGKLQCNKWHVSMEECFISFSKYLNWDN